MISLELDFILSEDSLHHRIRRHQIDNDTILEQHPDMILSGVTQRFCHYQIAVKKGLLSGAQCFFTSSSSSFGCERLGITNLKIFFIFATTKQDHAMNKIGCHRHILLCFSIITVYIINNSTYY